MFREEPLKTSITVLSYLFIVIAMAFVLVWRLHKNEEVTKCFSDRNICCHKIFTFRNMCLLCVCVCSGYQLHWYVSDSAHLWKVPCVWNRKDGAVSDFSAYHNKAAFEVEQLPCILTIMEFMRWSPQVCKSSFFIFLICALVGLLGSRKSVKTVAGSRGVLL